ncbi:NADPH-dependent 2,4-dienoyl-CoA reductase/sulfur reductase-like enzyme [Crossiella equi]|uniref:NADPH-dependent 2,4-dienoyl-CoA reductase/sulfur reductase-like enzyme n=1 Tax=Crossiella equi TaxID=130796 RepID=A0ABS5AUA4_9PSEU|nr:FAD-dependent oxidoreductase [Crossiella equi]MBP2479275.1 NADPH-dependent 2,4-dienoyl-CoA reductase/sulfur reductase-like enzyme [Crossiella equi]
MRSVAVIGGALAGLSSARALRAQGFQGRLTIIGAEPHHPYDRPPLSKNYLLGTVTEQDLHLADEPDLAELDAEWLLGQTVSHLSPRLGALELATGRRLRSDGVVIATGATPRSLPGAEFLSGVHVLRTLDDARALRADLTEGSPRVVVVGAGFIGAEVAATCATLGLRVTIVEAASLPLAPVLGQEMAAHCLGLHADHGVRLLCGVGVQELLGQGRVTGVALSDGRRLPADVVVVGIGVRPNTGWLDGSGLPVANGVTCDAGGVTALPNVVAVGDVANLAGRRVEHWTNAAEQPQVAVANLLAGRTVHTGQSAPYFWSDQYGVRIQFAGHTRPGDQVRITEGDADTRSFLAVYERDGHPVAALALNRAKPFTRIRRSLAPV